MTGPFLMRSTLLITPRGFGSYQIERPAKKGLSARIRRGCLEQTAALTGSRVGRAATRLSCVYRREPNYPGPARRKNQFDFGSVASIAKWFAAWMEACAEYRGSAALYEQLSRLSDAELRKRGLTRETLARYAFKLRD